MQHSNPHGGDIYRASGTYGIRREDILDYSANINPLGLPSCLKEIIISNIDSLVNYPDPWCSELRQEISQYLGVGVENIITGNGASEIIFLIFDVIRPKRVLIPAPSFSEYSKAAKCFDTAVDYFQLKEQQDFRPDITALTEAMDDNVDAVFLCNPNNPTSVLMQKEELLILAKHTKSKGISLIIDEAFIELTAGGNDNSLVPYLRLYDNIFIIRAFTKVFAIPGLRLGYGIGNSLLVNKMWERKMPWSVNSFACSLGKVLYHGREYLEKTCEWLVREKEWLYRELVLFGEFKVFKPYTNFILVKIMEDTFNAADLKDAMAAKGILIRDASNFKYLDDRFFRVAVKDRQSNERLVDTLKAAIGMIKK